MNEPTLLDLPLYPGDDAPVEEIDVTKIVTLVPQGSELTLITMEDGEEVNAWMPIGEVQGLVDDAKAEAKALIRSNYTNWTCVDPPTLDDMWAGVEKMRTFERPRDILDVIVTTTEIYEALKAESTLAITRDALFGVHLEHFPTAAKAEVRAIELATRLNYRKRVLLATEEDS